ncbi:hypothetical protein QL285_069502 [Trifolium repens]|nr:hypothetical protein QL285_069502 [Trifolium repens]
MNPTKGKGLTLIFPNIAKLCSLDETINDKKLEPFMNVPVKDWKFLYTGKDKMNFSAEKMIFGVAGIDPERSAVCGSLVLICIRYQSFMEIA